jgi:uncharacterized OB-fold protein
MSDARSAGYDDFLDALEAGEPYYLESSSGDGWLPPREVDPATGARSLERRDLPTTGEILTYTVVNVAGPSFADDTPYVVAVAEFGPVNVTGQVRGMDHADVDVGQRVTLGVGRNETEGERVVVFEPA